MEHRNCCETLQSIILEKRNFLKSLKLCLLPGSASTLDDQLTRFCLHIRTCISASVYSKIDFILVDITVEPCCLELAYFELPLISKRKSGPCFNMKL